MRGWGAAVAMVCLAGCGLTFDFEPPAPDAAVARDARVSMDAAPPPFDADVLDAAPRDAVVVDATPDPDGMVIPADAGPEWTQPDDIARVALFLAAHAPADMTGQFINLFGANDHSGHAPGSV